MAHTGDVKDAEDLTSQTFMAAFECIRSHPMNLFKPPEIIAQPGN
jgi:DNA-directed RNA polymerase specialized sigma24 family protein